MTAARIGQRVTYRSLSGNVTARIVRLRHEFGSSYLELRSTSRSNLAYPAGTVWQVPVLSAFVKETR